MAIISQIELPDGNTYDVKDTVIDSKSWQTVYDGSIGQASTQKTYLTGVIAENASTTQNYYHPNIYIETESGNPSNGGALHTPAVYLEEHPGSNSAGCIKMIDEAGDEGKSAIGIYGFGELSYLRAGTKQTGIHTAGYPIYLQTNNNCYIQLGKEGSLTDTTITTKGTLTHTGNFTCNGNMVNTGTFTCNGNMVGDGNFTCNGNIIGDGSFNNRRSQTVPGTNGVVTETAGIKDSGHGEITIGNYAGQISMKNVATSASAANRSFEIRSFYWPTSVSSTASVVAYIDSSTGILGKRASSIRYKENLRYDFDNEKLHQAVMNLKPCFYNYKADKDKNTTFSLIAEDVNETIPMFTVYNADKEIENYDERGINTALIAEVQYKEKQIQELKSEINDLKTRLSKLEEKFN